MPGPARQGRRAARGVLLPEARLSASSDPPDTLRLAVVGDVHERWDEHDVHYFNASDYACICFVGDLAAYTHRGGLRTAAAIAPLERPALVLPGNHDAAHLLQLVAEMRRSARWSVWLGGRQGRRCRELAARLAPVPLVGYSAHAIEAPGWGVTIVAARPHSMGGPHLAFRRHLEEAFGVCSLADSAARLRALVDGAAHQRLVFFAHNGPTGLGAARGDIWGCDFRPREGDFGDEDLRLAITHAVAAGKRVLAVVAGHMHQRLKRGGTRVWQVERDGTLYVNAARVPRIFAHRGRRVHHHVALTLTRDGARAEAVLVPAGADEPVARYDAAAGRLGGA